MTETSVEFDDGTVVENIDAIIFATGYVFGFPCIDHPGLEVRNNEIKLYKYVFPPDIQPPSIAVIGCIQPTGAIITISEMQCRWAARVFKASTLAIYHVVAV
jgi:dimethylaniline monooxygenase (N-oxide forming)